MIMKEWKFRYIDMSSFYIKHNILSINGLSLTPSMCWSIIKKKEIRDSKFFTKDIVNMNYVKVVLEDYIPHINGPLI